LRERFFQRIEQARGRGAASFRPAVFAAGGARFAAWGG
jgi:hypothetical protein